MDNQTITKDWLIKQRNAGKTQTESGQLIGKTAKSISYYSLKYGIKWGKPQRLSNINHKFFDEWSHNMAYILGWATADITIQDKTKGQKRLLIESVDRDLTEHIQQSISPFSKIRIRHHKKPTHKDSYITQISSNHLCHTLAELHVIPRRTGKEKLPDIPNKFKGCYLRGLFDGDGNISYTQNKKFVTTHNKPHYVNNGKALCCSICCSNYSFLEDVLEKLMSPIYSASIKKESRKPPKKPVYRLKITNKRDVEIMYNLMYNIPGFYLKRKKEVFERAII
jgi:hypothetical protein